MQNIIKISVLTALLAPAYAVSAQETGQEQIAAGKKISGVVIDAKTKEPLIGVFIHSKDKQFNQVTDINGAFTIEVADTVQVLEISYSGYTSRDVPVTDQLLGLEISLTEDRLSADELKSVQVLGRKQTTSISTSGAFKVEKIGSGELMKAACCNLSESFETTPSVDVGFTDAVSGYKQIQMLGLAGAYTSFTRENVPDIRGLAAITGLTFTPGTFVESMQLSKGAGSVVNGFEGTAGQINVEWLKPFEAKTPRIVLNGYQSSQGRSEGNLILNHNFNKHLSTSVLLHGRGDWMKVDMNKDGFLDNPMGTNFVGSNRWFYFGDNGLEIQGGFKAIVLNTAGGQSDYKKGTEQIAGNPWGYQNKVNRLETWAKIGKVYAAKPYKSMGLQLSGIFHEQENQYGNRDYNGKQTSLYANYIYQTIISNTNNVIKFGASALMDKYDERFMGAAMARTEVVPGAFVEYSYKWMDKINVVAGLRGDYNSIFGAFVTPRLHLRYAPNEQTAIRASVGRAQRTANMFAENMGLMASGRNFYYNNTDMVTALSANESYLFKPEVAWNMGLNLTKKFMLNYRDGTFGVDYYFTNFTNQVIADIEGYNSVSFYNLQGKSYSHSFQAQLDYEPIRFLDVRLAYRFYDVKTEYQSGLLEKPLVASHRAFVNLGYSTKNQWKFDYTVQWIGSKRLPQHYSEHHNGLVASGNTPAYWMMNAQINKVFKDGFLNVYAGVENVLNEMQHPLIMGASNPYGQNFDASLVWGSGMGRNIYAGFKLNIGAKNQ